jgi:predicted amidophosphoribosyltransferase
MKSRRTEKKEQQWCPYCEDDLVKSQLPYCQPCKLDTFYCPSCGKPVPRLKRICPACGASMKPKG